MKLTKIEKWFINRELHSKKVIDRAETLLSFIDIKPDYHMLEIGCGNGAVSKHIYDIYKLNVTGTDADREQIELAKTNAKGLKNITFLYADAANLPFGDKSFDIVLSINVLHHIYNWTGALKEINRVLKNGGYFIMADMFFNKLGQKMVRLYSRKTYGITTVERLNSFILSNNYSMQNSKIYKSFIWDNLEAIYKK